MQNWETLQFHHSAFFILHSPLRFQIVAAVNDAGVKEGGGTCGLGSAGLPTRSGWDRAAAAEFSSEGGGFGRAAARRAALRFFVNLASWRLGG